MKPIPIRRLRFVTALLSTLVPLAGPVFALPLLSASPAAADTQGTTEAQTSDTQADKPTITLDEVTPWVDEKGTLTVRGIVANPTDKAIEKPTLSLQNVDPQARFGVPAQRLEAGRV